MPLTYEYRLYPRKVERERLERLLDQSREVYNAALAQCKTAYEATGKHQTALKQWPYFRDWRNTFPDLLLNASSVQHTLRGVDKAYAAFFRRLKDGETPGHPRFKGQTHFKSFEYTYGDGCKLDYEATLDRMVLTVQNVGSLKIKLHRFLPTGATVKHVILKRKATGWYVFLQLEVAPHQLPLPLCNGLPHVGGDMGLLRLLTLSDSTEIDNPRWLRQALADLRRAQRTLSRAEKGSQNRKDKRLIVAKLHEHIANQRRDFWHRLTSWLVKHYGLIALEQLNLSFMTHNLHLSLSAHDAGLGAFQTLLGYKAVEAGSLVTWVNPAYTSQACSGCGELVEKPLSVRVHHCPNPEYLLELDRDVNAAINILQLALDKSARIGPSAVNVAAVQGKRRLRSSPIYRGK
ncbi:MAG: transposase [Chloroflexota bacterium]